MTPIVLALLSTVQAAEVEIATGAAINVLVDGVPLAWDEDGGGLGVVRDLPAGRHTVESRNVMGKTTAYKEIQLAPDDRIRFEYRQKELWHVNTTKIAPPLPLPPATTVETVSIGVPMAGPSIGITVHDGGDTVHIGAGVYGGAATQTTTVVTTNGAVFDAPVDGRHHDRHGDHGRPAPSLVPMDAGTFASLLSQVDDASFSDDKLSILRTAATHNGFTCAQLAALLGAMSFADDKLQAVAALRPAIVDPQNAFLINDAFPFSADAQKAQAYFR